MGMVGVVLRIIRRIVCGNISIKIMKLKSLFGGNAEYFGYSQGNYSLEDLFGRREG